MSTKTEVRQGTTYTFRRYEPGDAEGFLDLFEAIWHEDRSSEWFEWRYLEPPYLDHVSLFVAEADGEIVGTRPYLPFRMAVDDETEIALLTADTMVHPDHRRRGLFSTLTEQSIEFYKDGEPAFIFNQPNAASRPGFHKLGWKELGPMRTYYRIQDPKPLLEDRFGEMISDLLNVVTGPLMSGYLRARERLTADSDAFRVEVRSGVDIPTLTSLYRCEMEGCIHAVMDESYFAWRLASPLWERETYVAREAGEAVASIVARHSTMERGITVTQLVGFVPLSGDQRWRTALTATLSRIIDDHSESSVIAVSGSSFPANVLRSFGFYPDDRLPLSQLKSADSALCVRPIDDEWTMNGVDLTDPSVWNLTFGEQDTR